jgi:hypothetical protein
MLLVTSGLIFLISSQPLPTLAIDQATANKTAPDKPAATSPVLEGTGKIVLVVGEENVYGIESDTGKKYIPINLPELLKQDGLSVRVKVEKVKGQQGKQSPWGEAIRILSIAVDPCLTSEIQVQ